MLNMLCHADAQESIRHLLTHPYVIGISLDFRKPFKPFGTASLTRYSAAIYGVLNRVYCVVGRTLHSPVEVTTTDMIRKQLSQWSNGPTTMMKSVNTSASIIQGSAIRLTPYILRCWRSRRFHNWEPNVPTILAKWYRPTTVHRDEFRATRANNLALNRVKSFAFDKKLTKVLSYIIVANSRKLGFVGGALWMSMLYCFYQESQQHRDQWTGAIWLSL